jgi:hypothetical protein
VAGLVFLTLYALVRRRADADRPVWNAAWVVTGTAGFGTLAYAFMGYVPVYLGVPLSGPALSLADTRVRFDILGWLLVVGGMLFIFYGVS